MSPADRSPGQPPAAPAPAPDRDPAVASRIAWGLVALGALLRIARWLADRSLWGDEGSLAANLVERSFAGLAQPLTHDQAAPLGFLWLEKAVTRGFGEGELALRALPLLASLASLPLFLRLARGLLAPRAALIALALFAVCEPLVFYASELKPYASDVCIALVLVELARPALRTRPTPGRLGALAAAGLAAPWLSLPAVFVCAATAGVLFVSLSRRGDERSLRAVAAIAGLWLVAFAMQYAAVLQPLRQNRLLAESWKGYFAPWPTSLEALGWWGRRLLGFFNDPLGLPQEALAALLFALGAAVLLRRATAEALLLLAPIGLALLASLLGLHPFPTSSQYRLADRYYPFYGRLLLFSVPLALPFVGAGAGALLGSTSRFRRLAGVGALLLLLAAPLRQAAWNLFDPPRIQELRPLLPGLLARWEPGDRLYSQQYATGVVAYYAHRSGLPPLAGELVLEDPGDVIALYAQLAGLETGQRFWVVTLHHPHWRSEAERDAIASALAAIAERLDTLEGDHAEASLWRVTRARRDPSTGTPSDRHPSA